MQACSVGVGKYNCLCSPARLYWFGILCHPLGLPVCPFESGLDAHWHRCSATSRLAKRLLIFVTLHHTRRSYFCVERLRMLLQGDADRGVRGAGDVGVWEQRLAGEAVGPEEREVPVHHSRPQERGAIPRMHPAALGERLMAHLEGTATCLLQSHKCCAHACRVGR